MKQQMNTISQIIDDYFSINNVPIYGIASQECFTEAPKGFHPIDVFCDAKSVIVFGLPHLKGTYMASTTHSYGFVRNFLTDQIQHISLDLAYLLEEQDYPSVAISAIGPTIIGKNGRSHGIISLKHAAQLAGLGHFGKNSLILNETFGSRLWFGAVITSAPLETTSSKSIDTCIDGCTKCIDNCSADALSDDSLMIDQLKCWTHAFDTQGERLQIKCFDCRKVCPVRFGIEK